MDRIIESISNIVGSFGIFSGFFIIYLESIIPIIPSSVFIALNIITFGNITGFIISYLGVVTGSLTMYYLSKKVNNSFFKNSKNKKIKEVKKYIKKISFNNLVVLMAIPFTPAFAINIGAGISGIKAKKYFVALIIGKIPMVYFWCFIGKNLKESITDPVVIAKIIILIAMAFVLSKIIKGELE